MNAKSLTIGSIILGLLSVWASRAGGLVSDEQLLSALLFIVNIVVLGGVVLTFAAISYGISWGATQAYKMLYLKHGTWHQEAVKRKIYRVAVWAAGLIMLACGSFFLLAGDLTTQEKIVVGVFWLLACAFVGLSSPLVWRFVFENLMPRFKRWAKGRHETGNEALDRPSEKPE